MRASPFLALTCAGALAACVPSTAPITAASSSDAPRLRRYRRRARAAAQQRAQSEAVRDFARMMLADHAATTRQLTAAAQSVAISPLAPALLPMQARMMDRLHAAPAAAFDRLYLDQQVQAHQLALALHASYAANGDTPQLRTVAAAAAPVVQAHLDRLRQLAAAGGG